MLFKDTDKIYTKQEIISQLEKMNIPRNKVVLMHSSLRMIGKIEGGAEALLDAMIEYFIYDGGLFCVPTHTWANIRKEITLDMSDSKTCLGAFSDIAAADPRGIRSENPTHSLRRERLPKASTESFTERAATCFSQAFLITKTPIFTALRKCLV